MNAWAVFTLAFAAVVLQARFTRRDSPSWYLHCIVPLVYGAAVAWMFMGESFIRSLQVILFGAAIPITLLLSAWCRRLAQGREESAGDPGADPTSELP